MKSFQKANEDLAKKIPYGLRLALAIFTLLILAAFPVTCVYKAASYKPPQIPWVLDEGKQAKRRKVIEEFARRGVIEKIESRDNYHTVVVSDAFMALGFDEKKSVCGVIFMYYFPDPNLRDRFIELRDYRSGRSLGTYSPQLGLSLQRFANKPQVWKAAY